MLRMSWRAEELLASQQGLLSVELMSCLLNTKQVETYRKWAQWERAFVVMDIKHAKGETDMTSVLCLQFMHFSAPVSFSRHYISRSTATVTNCSVDVRQSEVWVFQVFWVFHQFVLAARDVLLCSGPWFVVLFVVIDNACCWVTMTIAPRNP